MIFRKNTSYLSVHLFIRRREWEEHMARGNWQPNYNNKEQKNTNSELLIYIILGIFLIIFQLIIVQQGLLSRVDLMQIKYQKEYNAIRQKVKDLTFEQQMDLVKEKMRIHEEEENRRKFDDKE